MKTAYLGQKRHTRIWKEKAARAGTGSAFGIAKLLRDFRSLNVTNLL